VVADVTHEGILLIDKAQFITDRLHQLKDL
jgi:hypothetical protein